MPMRFKCCVKCRTIVSIRFSFTSLIHGRKNVILNAVLFHMNVCHWLSKSWSWAAPSMLQQIGNHMQNGCLKFWKNVHVWKTSQVKATARSEERRVGKECRCQWAQER